MPESSSRKKPAKVSKPRAPKLPIENTEELPNPVWFKPVMFGFMILGLVWIITYYVSSAQYPLGAGTPWNLQNWNILIGFGIAMVGFMMSTRWK